MATKVSPILHPRNFSIYLQERPDFECQVLIKEPAGELPTSSQITQLHNEYVITKQLADVAGVRQLYAKEGSDSHPVLLLNYIQGQSLSELIHEQSYDLSQKLQISIEIAGILSRIHEQQVMHKDINPGNFLVDEYGEVYLIDFGIATTIKQEHQSRTGNDETLLGSLAYISPEQTGRVNRPIDYRTDLYSLGVTLYELFTSQLPFEADETLEMIHNHIARQPVPPQEIAPEIPRSLSDIIFKLLAKNAEDRYQTAHGLQVDLKTCLDQWQTNGWVEPFELGRDDFTGRLQIPPKLYGRQAEIDQLMATYDRVIHGSDELLLVAGYTGVGKTALVHEIHKSITAKWGYFVEGKFDQYRRTIPYAAWIQAFNKLVNDWMAENKIDIDQWRAEILKAVGQSGQVLIDIIPNLELVIGPQPEAPEMGGTETKNRFNYLFQRFVRTVATPEHPLVVFLDDLQWIDLASLKLLKTLLTDPDIGHFLIIGAYRDNEVDVSHTLMLGINDLQGAGGIVTQLTLGNLAREDINQLLSDSIHTPSEQCLPLARLVQAKTDGNAFYIHQLLHALEDDGLLSFDQSSQCWRWDLAELKKVTISENVIDLMVNKIQKLPVATQELLKIAACLGSQFELAMLDLFSGQLLETTQQALQPAYRAGLIIQHNQHSGFVHDQVQQAVYSLIPEPELAPLHWQIGRTLLAETQSQARDEHLFDLVGHLNLGSSLIETDAERIELVELNLQAAQQAWLATAYATAATYTQTAISLLAADDWQAHYLLMLKLHQLAAEAAYLKQDFEQSEHYIAVILANAESMIDRVPAYITQILVYQAQNLTNEAIETGLAVLDELGFTLLESEPAGVSAQAISDLAPMTDPRASAAAELLDNLMLPVFVARPGLLPSLLYTALHLNLTFGLHPSNCFTIFIYASFVWSEDIDRAYQFGELALQIIDKLDADRYLCRVRGGFAGYLLPWKSHYRTVEQALKNTVQLGLETGDKTYAMSFLRLATFLNFFLRDRLDQAQENMTQNIRMLQQGGDIENLSSVLVWTQFVANLRGRADDSLAFDGPIFDEASDLPLAQAIGQYQTTYYLYLLKMILHYHLGHFQAAFDYSEKAEPMLPNFLSQYLIPLLPFYQSLAILRMPGGQDQQAKLVEKLEQNLQKLQLWAHHAPMNHQHKVDLILAEQARVAGDVAGAIDHYEAAIAGARENAYLHEEALANELYTRFWIEQGNSRFAGQFMRETHSLYSRWGAAAIVEYLEAKYPQWLKIKPIDTDPIRSAVDSAESEIDLDLQSVIKASQAIGGEVALDKLQSRLMIIAMKAAGAQRGLLILEQDGKWIVEAIVDTEDPVPQVMQGIHLADFDEVSKSVVRYVARTQQMVVLGDAISEGRFGLDSYIQERQVNSLLCMPLLNQGQSSGILYLENNLAADVFTPERVTLLEMLAAQMAIAIDNARLYRQLEDLLSTRTKALSSAEDQIRSLFENSTLGITLTTLDGQVITTNQALLDMTGYTEAELQQRNIVSLYQNPQERALLLQQLQTKQSVQNFGVQARRKDGTNFSANLNASLVTHNEGEVLLTVIEDVTSKTKAEEALQTSQNLLQSALDALSANIAVLDQNGVIITVNASWRAFAEENGLAWTDYGLGRSYLEPVLDAAAQAEVDASEAGKGIQALLSAQEESFFMDYACHSPAEERWFMLRATRFDTKEGMRIVVSHENITERVLAEKQLTQAAATAERNRLARELHDSVTQALFTTTLFAQAGRKGVESGDLDSATHHLNRILETGHQAVKEMRLFIYDLLPEQFDHLGLVDAIQRRLNTVEKRAGIEVNLTAGELGDLPGPVNECLYRITQEALNNSLKHAQADMVKIIINRQDQRLYLEIIDNGQGFDPLEAYDKGGLGLISMRERTEQLGGAFNIDSVPQSGTRIKVVLEVSK